MRINYVHISDTLEIKPGIQYGLDPFKLFDTSIEAADIIGIVTEAPIEVKKEWRSICDGINNLDELYKKSSEKAKKYLEDLVKGSMSEIFKGDIKFSDRMIISLKHLDGQEYEGLFILLALTYAWKRVNALPSNQWKFLLLDEAWRMTKIAKSAYKIGEIARQGRKESLIFAISTQQFTDLDKSLDDESKLTELFDTKIIMGIHSAAFGQETEARGEHSASFGKSTLAIANHSVAFGGATVVVGEESAAFGRFTNSSTNLSFVIGRNNEVPVGGNAFLWVATDPLFVIGNGDVTGSGENQTPGTPHNAVTVLKNGNVGIGDSNPSENLVIKVTDTSDPALTIDSDGNEFTIGIDSNDSDKFKISDSTALGTNDRFVIDSSGNVGIGTADPQAVLSLGKWLSGYAGSDGDTQLLISGQHNSGANKGGYKLVIEGYDNDGTTVYPIYLKDENNKVDFWVKNRPLETGYPTMYFAGNVGIGTDTPNSKLQVIDGYIQLDVRLGIPPSADCDASEEYGRMMVDSTNSTSNLYVCTPSGWATK